MRCFVMADSFIGWCLRATAFIKTQTSRQFFLNDVLSMHDLTQNTHTGSHS